MPSKHPSSVVAKVVELRWMAHCRVAERWLGWISINIIIININIIIIYWLSLFSIQRPNLLCSVISVVQFSEFQTQRVYWGFDTGHNVFFAVPNAVANLLDLARGWGIRLKAGKLKRSRDSKWRIPRLKLQFFPSSLRTVLGTEAFY